MTTADPDNVSAATEPDQQVDQGAFELLQSRLRQQAGALGQATEQLNQRRLETFGGTELAVVGSVRIRTENNCVPRDIAQVGDRLVLGYNVFVGLRKETAVGDVFACHRFTEQPGDNGEAQFAFEELSTDRVDFLDAPRFQADFRELYEYYKSTALLQLRNLNGKLLAIFQTGASARDHKVLRWQVDVEGGASYVDNRGERDHVFAPSHDFEWIQTSREQHVQGRHPHVDILGKVFVETVGGDLTVKVEDNTEDGLGIYREPVEDADQSLDDGEIHYAELGTLILLKILPFREDTWRYLVFNTRTRKVDRIDAIGHACQQLPEDHGIIFPGGYYLQSGETKTFDQEIDDLEFVKRIRSPNGEDVLYVFHHREHGSSLLLPYNLIRKQVQTPITCNGWTVFDNGRLVIFRHESDQPTRVHTMQIWQTPFCTEEFAARDAAASAGSLLEQIGNAELVRGIAELLSLVRAAVKEDPHSGHYDELVRACTRTLDAYHWLDEPLADPGEGAEEGDAEATILRPLVDQMRASAERVVDEFEKVQALKAQAAELLTESEEQVALLQREVRPTSFSEAQQYVDGLARLRAQRGHLITLRDRRYIDLERLAALEQQVVEQSETVSTATAEFLQSDDALAPFERQIAEHEETVDQLRTVSETKPLNEKVENLESGVRLLADVASNLEIDDALVRTRILDGISEILGGVNRVRARIEGRRRDLRSREATGEFGVEFKLFGQSVTSALNLANSPEECDEALGRLMVGLEELEGRYADFDDFLAQLTTKREEVYEALTTRKQQLLDARQQRAEQLMSAAQRILETVQRRAASAEDLDALNAFFAADPMVAKLRDQTGKLRELGDPVKADELESALASARQEATRALRDRTEIFERAEGGGELIRLGKHRFSVNEQPLDLTLVPRGDDLNLHLTGTDFYERLDPEQLDAAPEDWSQTLVSETADLARAEYLAASILRAAEELNGSGPAVEPSPSSGGGTETLSLDQLHAALESGSLLQVVRAAAAQRYDEGYERGVHDSDAAKILEHLLALHSGGELLAFRPGARGLALLWFEFGRVATESDNGSSGVREAQQDLLSEVANLHRLRQAFGGRDAVERWIDLRGEQTAEFAETLSMPCDRQLARDAMRYLFEEIGQQKPRFVVDAEALELESGFQRALRDHSADRSLEADLARTEDLAARMALVTSWVEGYLGSLPEVQRQRLAKQVPLVAALHLTAGGIDRRESHAQLEAVARPMLGLHPRIENGELTVRLDDLLSRYDRFVAERVPAFRAYQHKRHEILDEQRHRLRIDEYKPRVLTSFVRNQLLDQVYLPLIGDNLAKQIGAAGDARRTDLMGLLLLISPPGYGKTTLMEYVASRLGLVFLKINGPSLGHEVTSFDPEEAPNATARQEVEKINLSFEMGNNVLLYLDDIQHTSSELLQKFISLCDGQRRVEGVWRGRTRTYDLRGKKFAVCMAGNPYTESGERFQIPDMLANRADVYNLGDILDGRDDLFALSYLENTLTSNSVLAPLAGRDAKDVHLLVRMARGENISQDELGHAYSSVELEEILTILRHLLRVQEVLLQVNQLYISSAAQDDRYRTEPPFQLQGSYRNMNKLAEKIVAVMNREELEALLDDHYLGEAQTLTKGAEWNLLRLRELRGVLSDDEQARITEVRRLFAQSRAMGGDDDDPILRVTGTLGLLGDGLARIHDSLERAVALNEQRVSEESERADEPTAAPTQSAELVAPDLAAQLRDGLGAGLLQGLGPLLEELRALAAQSATAQPVPAAATTSSDEEDDALSAEAVAQLQQVSGQIEDQLGNIVKTLQGIGGALGSLGSVTAQAPSTAAAGSNVRVVQTLGSGVHELLDELGSGSAEQLLELVRGISRWTQRQEVEADPRIQLLLDRTLSQLDRFKDLVNTLKRLDTTSLAGGSAGRASKDSAKSSPEAVPPPPPGPSRQG